MAGEWPEQWTRACLGEVADVNWGDTSVTKASYSETGFRAYSASGPDGFLPYADFERTGVVLSAIGVDCGKTWLAKGKWSCIKNTLRFWATSPDVDTAFLYWLTRDPAVWPKRGSAQPFISQGDARALEVAYPPLPKQRAIAHILGTLDDKIELNRRMSETLEAMARALFKSWFVDFDPVRARAEGRDPGLPKPLADLFPARLVDSELGEIPEGWEVGSVYEIADVIYGAPFSSAQFNTGGIGEPLIRIRDLPTESPSVWTPEKHPKGYKVRPGDVVVGMDGEFRAYLWGGAEGWLNQRTCVFKPKSGVSAAFVRNAIMQPLSDVESTETATTVIHLGKADIDRFKLVMPSPALRKHFDGICQPWYDRIVAAKQETRTLAAVRDTLLPKLISGELRVKDAERFIACISAEATGAQA